MMNKKKVATTALTAAFVAIAPLMSVNGDDYQFFNHDEGTSLHGYASYDAWRSSLNAGRSATSSGESLSARQFACCESNGGYLYSTEYHGFYMLIK